MKKIKEKKFNAVKADVNCSFSLIAPEKWKGYSEHPAMDNTKRQVKEATITPIEWLSGWFALEIKFEGKKRFGGTSPSVRGAKQQFAFQCGKGSKWEAKNCN